MLMVKYGPYSVLRRKAPPVSAGPVGPRRVQLRGRSPADAWQDGVLRGSRSFISSPGEVSAAT